MTIHDDFEEKAVPTYEIGYALSGGAAKGFAHLGVIKYLEEMGIKPDIIAGTSVGALVATLYSDGYSPDEIVKLFDKKYFKTFTDLQIPQAGFFATNSFKDFLSSTYRHKLIEDLPIPLRIVTTDLDNGKVAVFSKGPMVDIVRASCSIPVIFNPVEIDGSFHVDGGLFKNLPVSVIRRDCHRIVGVNLYPDAPREYKKNIIAIAERSFNYIFCANTVRDKRLCDLLLESEEISQYKMFSMTAATELMNLGYEMTKKAVVNCDWIAHYAKKNPAEGSPT